MAPKPSANLISSIAADLDATIIVQKAAIAAVSGSHACGERFSRRVIDLRDHMLARLARFLASPARKPKARFYVYPQTFLLIWVSPGAEPNGVGHPSAS